MIGTTRPIGLEAVPREQAIPRLVADHGSQLYRLATRLCRNRSEAEDLVQETFLQAWRKWDQFEGRSSPSTWLYAIAVRTCLRMHRKRAGEPRRLESLDELAPLGARRLAVVPEDGVVDGQMRAEARQRLEAEIVRLPVAFRLPIVLKEIAGLSVEQTASILGLKAATVKTRLHRGRLRLRRALETVLEKRELPPPAYSRQVCLDLLRAKQDSLDRGVPMASEVICERCRAVFASLDLTQDVCRELGRAELPDAIQALVLAGLRQQ